MKYSENVLSYNSLHVEKKNNINFKIDVSYTKEKSNRKEILKAAFTDASSLTGSFRD